MIFIEDNPPVQSSPIHKRPNTPEARFKIRATVPPEPRTRIPAENEITLGLIETAILIQIDTEDDLDIVRRRCREFERHVKEPKVITDLQNMCHIKTYVRRHFRICKIRRRQSCGAKRCPRRTRSHGKSSQQKHSQNHKCTRIIPKASCDESQYGHTIEPIVRPSRHRTSDLHHSDQGVCE